MFIKVCLLTALATVVMSLPTETSKKPEPTVEEAWESFKTDFERNYENAAEEATRFTIFKENVNIITEHNKKYDAGEITYKMGINDFADLTQEEFVQRQGGALIKAPDSSN